MTELSSERFTEIFLPATHRRMRDLRETGNDLVHYTSASNALRILRNKRVTLRNASLMNDFSEIDHGEKCVLAGWQSELGRGSTQPYRGVLFDILNRISPTIVPAIEHLYDGSMYQRKSKTFTLSLSEHNEPEDGRFGKLSMWRAYGGKTNVAIVVSPEFMYDDALGGSFSAPVHYSTPTRYADDMFNLLTESLQQNFEEVASLDRDFIAESVNLSLNISAMSTKHPGFAEEREWRIIFAPWMDADSSIPSEVIEIAGVPQRVYYLNLFTGDHLSTNYDFHKLFKKVIVGPTEHPQVIFEAMVNELEAAGVQDASKKVVVSDTPIRR